MVLPNSSIVRGLHQLQGQPLTSIASPFKFNRFNVSLISPARSCSANINFLPRALCSLDIHFWKLIMSLQVLRIGDERLFLILSFSPNFCSHICHYYTNQRGFCSVWYTDLINLWSCYIVSYLHIIQITEFSLQLVRYPTLSLMRDMYPRWPATTFQLIPSASTYFTSLRWPRTIIAWWLCWYNLILSTASSMVWCRTFKA